MSKLRVWGTRQDRYAYRRIKRGEIYQRAQGKKMRFLTLTGVGKSGEWRKYFDKLRRILRRLHGEFEYFSVRTEEGTGVLHILYAGKSIRWGELSALWKKISKSWVVSISRVKDFYALGIELTRQNKTMRYSQSRNWYPRYPVISAQTFKKTNEYSFFVWH